ncbi:MAG TPA: hypothetical protein VMU17_05500, partial [Elusimicrobiota bacterium]|nr:hypothetical protein [Elusimicrobiota bacterium]
MRNLKSIAIVGLGCLLGAALPGGAITLPDADPGTPKPPTATASAGQWIDFELNDLLHAVILCVQNPSNEAVDRITHDVSDLTTLIDRYRHEVPRERAPRFSLFSQAWQNLCQGAMHLMINSELSRENTAESIRLLDTARQSIRPSQHRAAEALAELADRQLKGQEADREKMSLVGDFLITWQQLMLIIREDRPAEGQGYRVASPIHFWPIAAAMLILLGGVMAAARRRIRRGDRTTLDDVIR